MQPVSTATEVASNTRLACALSGTLLTPSFATVLVTTQRVPSSGRSGLRTDSSWRVKVVPSFASVRVVSSSVAVAPSRKPASHVSWVISGSSQAISVIASMPTFSAPSTTSYSPLIWLQPAEAPIRVATNVRRTCEPSARSAPSMPVERNVRPERASVVAGVPPDGAPVEADGLAAPPPAEQAARTTVATARRPSVRIERMGVTVKLAGGSRARTAPGP